MNIMKVNNKHKKWNAYWKIYWMHNFSFSAGLWIIQPEFSLAYLSYLHDPEFNFELKPVSDLIIK